MQKKFKRKGRLQKNIYINENVKETKNLEKRYVNTYKIRRKHSSIYRAQTKKAPQQENVSTVYAAANPPTYF